MRNESSTGCSPPFSTDGDGKSVGKKFEVHSYGDKPLNTPKLGLFILPLVNLRSLGFTHAKKELGVR